jgi:class 3 adenylate cyclase
MTEKEILAEVKAIFKIKWQKREGRKVPEAEAVKLGNDAVTLDGTVLYADMAESTALVNKFKDWFAAEVYKAYLLGACRVIRNNGGEITAFDGDRVMAVFMGQYKNTSAAKTALQINHIVSEINAAIKTAYPNTAYSLRQKVGIDTGRLFVAKTGIRNSNDLVWVGRAANYAAKLSALGDNDYPSHITEGVFKKLSDKAKYGGSPKEPMWEKRIWTATGLTVYRSNWWWQF